jgi:signal transduction histidine kinase
MATPLKKLFDAFKNYFRRFQTGLFLHARLKLTTYYIVLMALILGVFSLALYYSLANNLTSNWQDSSNDGENNQVQIVALDKTIDSLQGDILIIDLVVLLLVSFLSWFLAGRTLKPIRKSWERQQQFSANASHELRTPLTIMKTDTEVTLRHSGNTSEDLRLLAVNNLEEIDRMSKIVDDLLILSRSEHLAAVDFLKIDLTALVAKLIKKIELLAASKKITVIFDQALPLFVAGQAEAIERMFLNIIQNAINYTPVGGQITVTLKKREATVELVVKDNGIGISEMDLSHVFERFYKADKVRSGEIKGAGLGLSIVKEIIDRHRGKLSLDSQLGQGTTVRVQLPRLDD